jgi:hypothetical protein
MDVKMKFANKEVEIMQGTYNNHTKLIHPSHAHKHWYSSIKDHRSTYTTHARKQPIY